MRPVKNRDSTLPPIPTSSTNHVVLTENGSTVSLLKGAHAGLARQEEIREAYGDKKEPPNPRRRGWAFLVAFAG